MDLWVHMVALWNPAATDLSRKTGSDSSTVERSEIGVSDTGPWRWPL